MSTLYTPESGAEPEADTPKRSLVARLPAPVFVIGYGALLIAVVVLVAMLASYESGTAAGASAGTLSTAATTEEQEPRQPWNPAVRDEDNVRASIRNYLITDVETGVTDTGVMLRGDITEFAEANLSEFTGHLSRLMQQNCLDTVVLTTADNFRMEILGFCFDAPALDALTTFTEMALEEEADSIAFVDYYGREGKEVGINWLNLASDRELDRLEQLFDATPRPDGFNRLRFAAYTPNEGYVRDDVKDEGIYVHRGPRFTAVDETAERTTTPQLTGYATTPKRTSTSTTSPTSTPSTTTVLSTRARQPQRESRS